jgi:hypothetical protein
VNAPLPDLDESKRSMKGIRRRIRRRDIDLADDVLMPAAMSFIE